MAAEGHPPFEGEKTTWHGGFDRYDFIMDDATGAITPMKAPEKEATSYGIDATLKDGKRRCVVVVPKKAAPGYPWSWQGCYWNHQPQTEVELLNRGFHIAYVAPDSGRQGKAWDRWYKFLTEEHGLSKKAAFIGMSKGGVNEFNWGVVNPEKVACIYADNPALYEEDFAKVPAKSLEVEFRSESLDRIDVVNNVRQPLSRILRRHEPCLAIYWPGAMA
jgi:hypothetical protein